MWGENMNDIKKNTAPRAATPETARNIEKSTANNIAENSGKIKIVLQCPGEISRAVWMTGHMNDVLNGHTTVVTIPENGLSLVFNMYSDRRGKPNLKTLWGKIYGAVLVTRMEGKHYVSLTPEQIQAARGWLLRHTYEEAVT